MMRFKIMNEKELGTNGQFSIPANWSIKLTVLSIILERLCNQCIFASSHLEFNKCWLIVLYEN